ncbi:hypothetical protein AVDCRST_MAG81-5040 [uncultured Synechococcales cyanobacterium]|uniref:Uncharacterized protein n=1 Tax=uncultured Synechococcales cyanobacterium TaxID=1936017 RepID=A0A6J4VYK5_9CYAN|nr:hypothetical protein AVDCRST_MAG81-5040 [uncultured Synechococcales cyanobacterium]
MFNHSDYREAVTGESGLWGLRSRSRLGVAFETQAEPFKTPS